MPWEEFPIDEIEVRDIACNYVDDACASGLESLVVSTVFTVVNPTDVTVVSQIPGDFFYVSGSARLYTLTDDDTIVTPLPDPVVDGDTLTFPLGNLDAFEHFVEFAVLPGYTLGAVTFESDVNGLQESSEEVAVVQAFEPDSVVTAPDTLYVAHVAEPGDIDS